MGQQWDIRREGRAWAGGEGFERYSLTPEKIELISGKLLWSDEERLTLLALLLENVGVDRAIQLGKPSVWVEAILDVDDARELAAASAIPDSELPAGAEGLSFEPRTCAVLLAHEMSGLSEDYWAASWLIDLEYELWAAVHGESNQRIVGDATLARLRYLSAKSGGWIEWQDSQPHRRYVSLAEWEAKYASWRSRRGESPAGEPPTSDPADGA